MFESRLRSFFSSAVVLVLALVLTPIASAEVHLQDWGNSVTPLASDEEIVFNYDETLPPSDCRLNQFPDSPPRAFRNAAGQTQLVLPNTIDDQTHREPPGTEHGGGFNFRMIGTSLDDLDVEQPCNTIYGSGMETVPDNFNNQEWLAAPYTTDGQTVYALIHNEYHGWEYPPDGCDTPQNGPVVGQCWYNAITLGRSTDGGASYSKVGSPPNHRVATFPYRYERDKGPAGYFQPSNIVKKDSYYYAFLRTDNGNGFYPAQKRGDCLIRTNDLTSPGSWRGWDGTGFNVSFVDPYHGYDPNTDPPQNHLCQPVAPDPTSGPFQQSNYKIATMTDSLTYNTYFGQYLLVGIAFKPNAQGNWDGSLGVYYSLSEDLINWSERQLVAKVEVPWIHDCTPPDPVSHFAVLDHGSSDLNYGTTGQDNYLYYIVSHFNGCTGGRNRDIVRIPFRFHAPPVEARSAWGGSVGCLNSFDKSVSTQTKSFFLPNGDRDYTGGSVSYRADVLRAGTTELAAGVFDRQTRPTNPLCEFNNESQRPPLAVGEDDEIRYGGAFVFPTTGFWDRLGLGAAAGNVTIMRLTGRAPGWAGAVLVNKDGNIRFSTSTGGGTTQLHSGTLPKDDCWHWIEVYQKLSSDPAKAVNRFWIDGSERTTLDNVANFSANSNGGYGSVAVGIPLRNGPSNVFLYTDYASIGYPNPLLYLGCHPGNDPGVGKLEVRKALEPASDAGRFNLQMDGNTDPDAQAVGNGGSTGEQAVAAVTHTVGETAASGTQLSSYSTSIVCRDQNGAGNDVASDTGNGPLTVYVPRDADIVCTITNTRLP